MAWDHLRSQTADGNIASELSSLFKRVQDCEFNYKHYRALSILIIGKGPRPRNINNLTHPPTLQLLPYLSYRPLSVLDQNASSTEHELSLKKNTSRHRNYVDELLKEELGPFHVDNSSWDLECCLWKHVCSVLFSWLCKGARTTPKGTTKPGYTA